jgi:hypothetical protein
MMAPLLFVVAARFVGGVGGLNADELIVDEKTPTPVLFSAATLKSYGTFDDGTCIIAVVVAEFVLYVFHVPTGGVDVL